MNFNIQFTGLLLIGSILLPAKLLSAGSDWPMWRYDPGRRASTDITLPDNPVLLWTRQMEEPKRCWPFQYEEFRAGRD